MVAATLSFPVWTKNSCYYSRRPEPECIALPVSMINQAGTSSCDGTFPVSLIYALIVSPAPAVTSTLCLSLPKMLSIANAFKISDHQYNPR
jgi:hypothetical protein